MFSLIFERFSLISKSNLRESVLVPHGLVRFSTLVTKLYKFFQVDATTSLYYIIYFETGVN